MTPWLTPPPEAAAVFASCIGITEVDVRRCRQLGPEGAWCDVEVQAWNGRRYIVQSWERMIAWYAREYYRPSPAIERAIRHHCCDQGFRSSPNGIRTRAATLRGCTNRGFAKR